MLNSREDTIGIRGDKSSADTKSCREIGRGIVRSFVGNADHGDDHAGNVDPDSSVCEPAELLQCADLTKKEAGDSPDETADGEAELELCSLGKSKTVGDDDGADVEDELDGLQDVEEVAHRLAVKAETHVTVTLEGELVRVHAHEDLP